MSFIIDSLANLTLTHTAEHQYLCTICEWERLAYGEGFHRTPDVLHACADKNNTGFFLLIENEELIGYIDIWQLASAYYADLRLGNIYEESLCSDFIRSSDDVPTYMWYIGSLIVSPKLRKESPAKSSLVFASLWNALPRFIKARAEFPSHLLGVGSSSFGQKLMTRCGFAPVTAAATAIDLRPRYEARIFQPSDVDKFFIAS